MNATLNRANEWISPDTSPWVLAMFTLAAVGLFASSVWNRLGALRFAKSEDCFDRPAARLLRTLRIAFAQTRLFKESAAGWMHALIFWGFCILLLRSGQFFFIGFFPSAGVAHSGGKWLCNLYGFAKDSAVLLVTLAALYGLYRRLVLKPRRLPLSFQGNLILALILVLMISDALFDGTWLALHADARSEGGFLGDILSATLLHGAPPGVLSWWHECAYWLHVVTILLFLNLLPHSKHFHILTSIPNVYFSDPDGRTTALHRMNFEDESGEATFGLVAQRDFTWKQALDLHTCTECGRCDVYCPALNSGKPLSPRQLTLDLRGRFNAAKEADAQAVPLLGGVIQDETLWSCTTCGACEEECPVLIGYVDKIVGMRRGLVLTESRYPHELDAAFRSLEVNGNPWGFSRDARGDWARELDVPLWDKDRPSEYLYFAGCNGSFDTRGRKIAADVVALLRSAKVDFSVLGADEGCTGDPARRLGNEYLYEQLAGRNAELLRDNRVRKIIVHCPHCFHSFKNEYPEFGLKLEVIHHSDLFARLADEGMLDVSADKDAGTTVLHDSCYLGRHNGMYDPPRRILDAVAGADAWTEPETSRERGACCGAGGGRFLLEEKTGTRMNRERLGQLMRDQPRTIAVSCPYCVLMLEDAARTAQVEVRVRDVAELLAENLKRSSDA